MAHFLSYKDRIVNFQNQTAKDLLECMERKRSNLSVALDLTKKQDILRISNIIGPYICVLKVFL